MRWLLLVFVVAACGGSNSSSSTGGSPQALVVQAVGTQSSAIAAPGGTLQLAAYESVAGSYGGSTLQQVMASWSSSDTAVVTVDPNGVVTAVANGTAVITATAGSATGQATVTVGATPAAVTIEWNLGAQTSPVSTTITAGTPVQ